MRTPANERVCVYPTCLCVAGGSGAPSQGRIYPEEGQGSVSALWGVEISWCFQLGWLIPRPNHEMLSNLLSYLLGTRTREKSPLCAPLCLLSRFGLRVFLPLAP